MLPVKVQCSQSDSFAEADLLHFGTAPSRNSGRRRCQVFGNGFLEFDGIADPIGKLRLKPCASDVVSLNPCQSILLKFLIHGFSPWFLRLALFLRGCVVLVFWWGGVEGLLPPQNVGGHAALGPATRCYQREIGQASKTR